MGADRDHRRLRQPAAVFPLGDMERRKEERAGRGVGRPEGVDAPLGVL
jgi:hypothetical protein